VSTIVIFGMMYLAPGDTLRFLSGGRSLTPEAEAAFREQFSLDDPLPVRYLNWVTAALQGDFGQSLVSRVQVTDLLAPRIGTTALLLVMASVIVIIAGIVFGLVAGLAGRRTDVAITAAVNLGMAVPQYVVAALLTAIFAVGLGWFPVFGNGSGLADQLYHLVLPAVALALASTAYIARITRVAVREESSREFVETARTRGLPSTVIIRRHVLRNALIPVTTVAGLSIAGLVASSVVVESAFGLNGLGSLLIQSVLAKDFAVVQAVSLIFVVLFLAVNLIVDALYVVLDPRLRTGAAS
jgi:peptide/nickel transport system permease protein